MADEMIIVDDSEIKAQMKRMKTSPDKMPAVMTRALNKTVTGMNTDAAKEAAKTYIIKQKDVKASIKISKANWSNLAVALRSQGRPIALVKFKYKKNPSPGKKDTPTAFAQVRKDHSGGYTGGFVATMKSGHTGLFVRKSTSSRTAEQQYGPGVAQMLEEKNVSETVQEKGIQRFYKNLDHEVGRHFKSLED